MAHLDPHKYPQSYGRGGTTQEESIQLIKLYGTKLLHQMGLQDQLTDLNEGAVQQQTRPSPRKGVTFLEEPSIVYLQSQSNPQDGNQQSPWKPCDLSRVRRVCKRKSVSNPFTSSNEFARAKAINKRANFMYRQIERRKEQIAEIPLRRSRSPQQAKMLIDSFLSRYQDDIRMRKVNRLERIVEKAYQAVIISQSLRSTSRSKSKGRRPDMPSNRYEKELWQLRKQKRLQDQQKMLRASAYSIQKGHLMDKIVRSIVIPGAEINEAFSF